MYESVPVPAPPEIPPESELKGATFAASACDRPADFPANSVVALLMSGPMLLVAARIF